MNELFTHTTFELDPAQGEKYIKKANRDTLGIASKILDKELHELGNPEHHKLIGDVDLSIVNELVVLVAALCAEYNDKLPDQSNVRAITPATLIMTIAQVFVYSDLIGELYDYDSKNGFKEIKELAPNEKAARLMHWMGREEYVKAFIQSLETLPTKIGGAIFLEYLQALK